MPSQNQKTDSVIGQLARLNQNSTRNEDESPPYGEYENRGRLIKALIDANPTKDKILRPPGKLPKDKNIEFANLSDGYNHATQTIFFPCDTHNKDRLPFSYFNLPPNTEFVQLKWYDRMKANVRPGEPDFRLISAYVNIAAYNAKEGAIVMSFLSAKNDGWPDDAPQRNYCSEITWQSWKKVAGSGCAILKLVFQDNVQNQGTREVIEAAYKQQNPLQGAPGTFSMKGSQAEQRAFLALLGTDNVRPTEYMLIDHFEEMGKKKIQRIHVFPYQGFGIQRSWHMVLEVGSDAESLV
jgi:hypothetical protein